MHGEKDGITLKTLGVLLAWSSRAILAETLNQSWDQRPSHIICLTSKVQMEGNSHYKVFWNGCCILRTYSFKGLVPSCKGPRSLIRNQKEDQADWHHWVEPGDVGVPGIHKDISNRNIQQFPMPSKCGPIAILILCVYYYTDIRPAVITF